MAVRNPRARYNFLSGAPGGRKAYARNYVTFTLRKLIYTQPLFCATFILRKLALTKYLKKKSELCKDKFTQSSGNLKNSEKIFYETVRKIVDSDQVPYLGWFYRT